MATDQYQDNTIYNTKKYYRYCEKELASIPIINFDYPLLQKYFNSRKDKGLETNNGIKKTINRVLNYAIKADYIKVNQLPLVTIKGVENHIKRDEVLSNENFLKLTNTFNSTKDFKKIAYSVAIQIGYYTGLRISEVLALDKKDILLNDNLIDVNKKLIYCGLRKNDIYVTNKMKSKKSKAIIPLAEILKEALIEWFEINPYEKVVCDEDGNYIPPDIMSGYTKKLANQLHISFHFHMPRHTFATNLVTSNVDLKTTQELMRHSNIDTIISIYTHINNQHKVNVVNDIFNTKSVEKVSD